MATGQTIQHLIITGGKTIKMMTRNQIPPVRMDTLKGRQRANVGDSQLMIEPHYTVGGNGRRQQPLTQNISEQGSDITVQRLSRKGTTVD